MDAAHMLDLTRRAEGGVIDMPAEALELVDMRVLANYTKTKARKLLIPRERPLELLDLRVIFSELRRRAYLHGEPENAQDLLPFDAFQRGFERMFFLLGDAEGFDARTYDMDGDGTVTWGEFFRVWKRRGIITRLSFFERVYLTLDNPDSSILALIISILLLCTIIVSALGFIVSTIPECYINPGDCVVLEYIEKVCLIIFAIEYGLRACTAWAVRTEVHDKARFQELIVSFDPIIVPSAGMRFLRFLLHPPNVIDLIAISPGVIAAVMSSKGGAFVILRLIRLTRVFRAFNSPAFVAPLVVIGRAVQQSTKALYVLAFNLSLGVVISGSLMYMAEGGEDLNAFHVGGHWNETRHRYYRKIGRTWTGTHWEDVVDLSPYQSIPHSFWWAVVTATTVGYGDDYPTTSLGKLITVATMLFSMVVLALPVGVMGGTFAAEWAKFQKEKAIKATTLKHETMLITAAIRELDPWQLARTMVVEVWQDRPNVLWKHRPPAASFLGEAKVRLELHRDRDVTKELRIPLEENPDLVKRSVRGHVLIKYQWTPVKGETLRNEGSGFFRKALSRHLGDTRSSTGGRLGDDEGDNELRGTLRVTVIRAENLLNISFRGGVTEAFCTVLCWPTYYKGMPEPKHCVWRSPTTPPSLSPKWDASFEFQYAWGVQETLRKADSSNDAMLATRSPVRLRTGQAFAAAPPGPVPANSVLDQTLELLRGVAAELRAQRGSLRKVKDDVAKLAGRVDLQHSVAAGPGASPSRGASALPPGTPPTLAGTLGGGDSASPTTSLRAAANTALRSPTPTSSPLRKESQAPGGGGFPRLKEASCLPPNCIPD